MGISINCNINGFSFSNCILISFLPIKSRASSVEVSKLCRYESELYMQTQWKRGTKFSIGMSILEIPVE